MKASFFLQTKSWEPCETKEYSYDKGMLHIRINGIESSTTEGLEEEVLGGLWKGAGEHCNDNEFQNFDNNRIFFLVPGHPDPFH